MVTSPLRCIKPNDVKSSEQFNRDKVRIQLKYTGIMETTRIRKEVSGTIMPLVADTVHHVHTHHPILPYVWSTTELVVVAAFLTPCTGILSQNCI